MLLLFTCFQVQAQRGKEKLQEMIGEDRTTIDAIAGYDENVRQDILILAQTPEVLNVLEDLQKKSERRFRDIINDYDRDSQSALYEMARYPDLISDLIRNGKPSQIDVNRIVSKYPADIQETAKKNARSCYNALTEIDRLNNQIDQEFQSDLTPYDDQTRESVRVLLKYPEIVSILVEDKDFTRLLGQTYQEDPDWVINQLDTISRELEDQNQKDLAAYKNQIEKDPEAYNEMMEAAQKFADESNIARENEEDYSPDVEINVIHSYPFWFGYPYWYPYAYWRPYPVYYHTGFYMGPNRRLVFVGLPSNHFIYWQTHYHPNLYPHLSYSYYNFYHNHYLPYRNQYNRPVSHYGFYRSVERNVINNPRVNNDNLGRIDRRRGANIINQRPSGMNGSNSYGDNSYLGRRSSGAVRPEINNNSGFDSRGSVRRDAFPRTTPSPVRPSEGSYRRGSLYRENSAPSTRSGNYPTPSFNQGRNQSNPSVESSRGYLNSEKRNNFQQRNNEANPSTFRSYRNYKATEPRQTNPSFNRREAPQRMSPAPAVRSGGSRVEGNRGSGGGFRNSREK